MATTWTRGALRARASFDSRGGTDVVWPPGADARTPGSGRVDGPGRHENGTGRFRLTSLSNSAREGPDSAHRRRRRFEWIGTLHRRRLDETRGPDGPAGPAARPPRSCGQGGGTRSDRPGLRRHRSRVLRVGPRRGGPAAGRHRRPRLHARHRTAGQPGRHGRRHLAPRLRHQRDRCRPGHHGGPPPPGRERGHRRLPLVGERLAHAALARAWAPTP